MKITYIENNKYIKKPFEGFFNFKWDTSNEKIHDNHAVEVYEILLKECNTFLVITNNEDIYDTDIKILSSCDENVSKEIKEALETYKDFDSVNIHYNEFCDAEEAYCELGLNIFAMKFESYEMLTQFLKHKKNSALELSVYTTLINEVKIYSPTDAKCPNCNSEIINIINVGALCEEPFNGIVDKCGSCDKEVRIDMKVEVSMH